MTQAHYFLGWPVPESVKKPLLDASAEVNALAHYKYFTDSYDLHMTAVFLGAVESELLHKIDGYLSENIPQISNFSVRLSRLGFFGQPDHPRVVIYEGEADERFYRHRKDLFSTLSNLGMSLDQKPFHPHVTLAKKLVSASEAFGEKLENLSHQKSLSMSINALNLYKVHPAMTPRYERVKQYIYKN